MSDAYRRPNRDSVLIAAITALTIFVPVTTRAQSAKPPYMTATAAQVQSEIVSQSKIMGEANGDTYYYKPALGVSGTGQIFRISNSDPTKFAGVGLIMNNKYQISPAEKSGFFAVVTDRPAGDFTGVNSIAPSAAQQPAGVPQPPAQPSASAVAASVVFSGKASWEEDGHIPVVRFDDDSKFNNDLVAWRKGHIEISRDGSKFADLGYEGGGYGEGAGKKGLKMGLTEMSSAVSNGRNANALSMGWEITTVKGVRNTSIATAASMNGIYQTNPYGLEGEAVAATEIFKKQVDPNFTYPGYEKLRQAAGLDPRPPQK